MSYTDLFDLMTCCYWSDCQVLTKKKADAYFAMCSYKIGHKVGSYPLSLSVVRIQLHNWLFLIFIEMCEKVRACKSAL